MKILIITSKNSGSIHPFIKEQVDQISTQFDISFDFFFINKKGILGYIKEGFRLRKQIKENKDKYSLIHAHYGLSGLVACFQFTLKKIVTFHGSDINYLPHRIISQIVVFLSNYSIFVSEQLKEKVIKKRSSVIPCGINLENKIHSKEDARKKLGWKNDEHKILFSSSFNRLEKDPELAKSIVESLRKKYPTVELIELSGYSRQEVNLLMCACDMLLLTSKREGSPQVIKEALYFKLPIVSTNVGVIEDILRGTDHTFICESEKETLVQASIKLLEEGGRIVNNGNIELYDNSKLASQIFLVYQEIVRS